MRFTFYFFLLDLVYMSFLKNHYIFAITLAVLTAILSWLYARTLPQPEKDDTAVTKVFYKTLVAGLVGGLALAWFVSRPDDILTTPYVET